jgi:hypothetical protein
MDKNVLNFKKLLNVTLKHHINNELMKIMCFIHEMPEDVADDISKSVHKISNTLDCIENLQTIKTKPYIEGVQMLDLEGSMSKEAFL